MLRNCLLAISIVIGCGAACLAEVTFERKIAEGSSHTVETASHIEQKLTIAGMQIDTSSDSRQAVKSVAGKRDAQGNLRIAEKVESLQISVNVMGMNYTFDSANPDNKGTSSLEMLRDVHKALTQRTTTVVLDKENKVAAVEVDRDIVNSQPPEVQALVKSQLDPEHLKTAANEMLDQVKTGSVNVGDTWKRTRNANVGGGQILAIENEFTYVGPVEKNGKKLDKITSKTVSVDLFLQDSPLPFTFKDTKLTPAESDGLILFDRELGQIAEATSSLRITGDFTFVINGMDLPAKLDLKMQSNVTVKR